MSALALGNNYTV